jgi:putative peptide zinc metalloprotease protein
MDDAERDTWKAARPSPVPDVLARRVILRGEPAMVLQDPSTGRHFRASILLYRLVGLFDGRRTVAEALDLIDRDRTDAQELTLMQGVAGMAGVGLLRVPGLRRAARPTPPGILAKGALQRVIFVRLPLGNLGPALPVALPVLGWLYTRTGVCVLAGLIVMAAWAWVGEGPAIDAQFDRLANMGPEILVIGWLLFAASKMLHEIGHAVATHRMGAAEGLDLRSFRWGISFMFLMPAPYVEVTPAWLIGSRGRRAWIGLAGIQVDLLVAAVAALVWAQIGQGAFADRLFELVLLCGISSLLFNANPLLRLDGYYVLSDLLGIPNMQARAWAALRRAALWPMGLDQRPHGGADLGYALYAVASWCWRWAIYIGIFWLAGAISWVLAAGFAAVIGILFVSLPLARGLVTWGRLVRAAPLRAAIAPAAIAGVVAAFFLVPVPHRLVAEGIIWHEGITLIYAPADGLVRTVAPAGPVAGPVVQLENPDLRRTHAQLRAEAAALVIEARRARTEAPQRIDALAERQRAVASQIAAVETEIASWAVTPASGGLWYPLRAEHLTEAWVRRDDARPLGVVSAPGPVMVRLVLDQWDGPAGLAALASLGDGEIALRQRGEGAATLHARVAYLPEQARDELPSLALSTAAGGSIATRADTRGAVRPEARVFEVRLALVEDQSGMALRHGTRVEALIWLPDAPLADIVWYRLRQALQHRLGT